METQFFSNNTLEQVDIFGVGGKGKPAILGHNVEKPICG